MRSPRLPLVSLICKACGNPYQTYASHVKWRGSAYCSRKCQWSMPKTTVRVFKCRHCGKQARVELASTRLLGRGKFCDRACFNAWNREKRSVKGTCERCGKSFTRCIALWRKSKYGRLFCSRLCSKLYHVGKNHHAFRPGSVTRGRRWRQISRRVILRDGRKCVRCGAIDCNLPVNHFLHVDHILPVRMFKGRKRLMNRLSNLATLCVSCHGKKTTKYEPRMLKGDMLAIQEFYGLKAKENALALLAEI